MQVRTTGAIYEAKYNSSVHDFGPLFQEVNGTTLKLKLKASFKIVH